MKTIKSLICTAVLTLLCGSAMAAEQLDSLSGDTGANCPSSPNGIKMPCNLLSKLPINTKGDKMPCSLLSIAEKNPALANNPMFMIIGTAQKYMPSRFIISNVVMR